MRRRDFVLAALPALLVARADADNGDITVGSDVIRLYPVKYATPKELMEILKQLLPNVTVVLGPQPKYIRDTTQGEVVGVSSTQAAALAVKTETDPANISDQFVRFLVLKGTDANVKSAIELLMQLDLPAPQVQIEARIIDMSEGLSRELGVTYDFAPGGNTAKFKLDKPKRDGDFSSVFFGRLSRDVIQFNAALEAAIQKNRARLLASPKLSVLYNHRARIFIGDEVTYLLGTRINQNGTTLETGQVRIGVELNVTAVGNPDGTITLKVNPEVGSLLQLETQANGLTLPRISRRTVQTAVRLQDGETMVIGGLIGENEVQTLRKLPILGDLPVLGTLFRRDETARSKSELIILLTATIVKEAKPVTEK
jgi:type II secretory pathway component GspD/PulD (secretin)